MPSSKPSRLICWLVSVEPVPDLLHASCSRQGTGGRILGRVADSSGAVLAGVKVTLTNEATGVSRESVTNEQRRLRIPAGPGRAPTGWNSIWPASRRTLQRESMSI